MSDQPKATHEKNTREPVQARGRETRARILAVGEKLFIEKGYHQIMMDDIAQTAGVSVGSSYRYFKDKRELFIAVLDRISEHMMTDTEWKISELLLQQIPDPRTAIRQILESLVDSHRVYLPLFEQANQMAFFDETLRQYNRESDQVSLQIFEGILRRFAHLPEERIRPAASTIFYASEGIIHKLCAGGFTPGEQSAILNESTDMVLRYIESI
jgi:AcrR family transcriptional regulator